MRELHHGDRLAQATHAERGTAPGCDKDKPSRLDAKTWLVERFNWTWFVCLTFLLSPLLSACKKNLGRDSFRTCTQSTGGLAIVLGECPKQFNGLHIIGAIVFIFNIVLWLTFTGLVITRWTIRPEKFRASFTQPPECFFYGSWWLSIATIIICMNHFGVPQCGPWLVTAIRICFWSYAACTLLSSAVVFLILGKHSPLPDPGVNPAILLTVFHTMLTGTIAAAVVSGQPESHRLPMMIAGVSYQGFGWIMSMVYLSYIFSSILQNGFPPASSTRPGFFMLVGTAGYTIVVLIGNARGAPKDYGYFASHPMAAEVLLVLATWTGVFLWVFTFWCFAMVTLSIFSDILQRDDDGHLSLSMSFHNTWWAFIFPNVGFTLSTIYLGQEFDSEAILWLATAMVILLVIFWLFDIVMFFKAIIHSILWDSRVKLS